MRAGCWVRNVYLWNEQMNMASEIVLQSFGKCIYFRTGRDGISFGRGCGTERPVILMFDIDS